jgi:hypothetical protein
MVTAATTTADLQDQGDLGCEDKNHNNYSTPSSLLMHGFQRGRNHAAYDGCIPQTLEPFLVLPYTDWTHGEAMSFFENTSIAHLDQFNPCASWRNTLMFFCQTVPPVRYAAAAVALMHRRYLDCESDDSDRHKAPLVYYNRAIRLLLNYDAGGDSNQIAAITLFVCYLFTSFDHLAGNHVQAMQHLRGGVELSRTVGPSAMEQKWLHDAGISEATALMNLVSSQIRRLDMQAAIFLVDWTPADIQEGLVAFQLPDFDSGFASLEQAAEHLQILIARVMRLRNAAGSEMPRSGLASKQNLLVQLGTWSHLFESMLLNVNMAMPDNTAPDNSRLLSLLRIQHTIAWIFLASHGPTGEMEYDRFVLHFEQCIASVACVAAGLPTSSNMQATFTPEVGIVPVLYLIGAKCRQPLVRREVLRILRQHPIREAVWDSTVVARVVSRVIEIEEGVDVLPTMDQIPVWQRIQTLSWVNEPRSDPSGPRRVELNYTFCDGTQDWHSESLSIK